MGIVGLPIPDETLMTFVGSLTAYGPLSFTVSLIVSFAGAMSGMLISYFLGKKVGKPFLYRMGRWVKLTPGKLEKAEQWFNKYGIWTVSFGYFVPGVRHFTCYLAGVSGVTLWRYLLFAGSGAFVWCAAFLSLGRWIGSNFESILLLIHRYALETTIVIIVLLLIGMFFYLRHRRKATH
jgi:membrane protein DedA with SNARE-associated domain